MSWQDTGMYWAWRSPEVVTQPPPTEKKIHYAKVFGSNSAPFKIACAVTDTRRDGQEKTVLLHQGEIARLRNSGYRVEIPGEATC